MPWPTAQRKKQSAVRGLERAKGLHEFGDAHAAWQEAATALHHWARGVLLEKGVFPLSRPELADQLETVGESWASNLLMLTYFPQNPTLSDLTELLTQVDSRLKLANGCVN